MGGEERRKSFRKDTKVPVKLRAAEGSSGYSSNAESLNISDSGLLFTMQSPIAIGTMIELAFVMPGEVTGGLPMKVRCTGRVVRLIHEGMEEGKSGIAAEIQRFETIIAEQ